MGALLTLALFAGSVSAGEIEDLRDQLGSSAPEARAEARARLIGSGEKAVEALVEGLGAPDLLVATGCADVLGEGGFRAARRGLPHLLRDCSPP